MAQSAAFCRAQEAIQRERAAGATLENVRTIAVSAAVAWQREGLLAQQREDKRSHVANLPEAGSLSEEQEDHLASENPDRGMNDAD
jgi:hypothetical protein